MITSKKTIKINNFYQRKRYKTINKKTGENKNE